MIRAVLSTPRRRLWLALLVGVLAFAAYAVNSVDTADSHANQLRSSPSPDSELETSPERVVVWFSEEIEASLSEVRVIDANARQVDNGDSSISPTQPTALIVTLPALDNGTYTVVWRNLSTVDGHRVVGSFRFSVGEPLSASVDVPVESQPLTQSPFDPWFRWLTFVGVLTLVGTLLFDLLVIMPLLDSRDAPALNGERFHEVRRIMYRTTMAASGLVIVGLVALLFQQAAVTFQVSVFAVFGNPLSSVLASDWGRLWMFRVIAVLVTGGLVLLAGRAATPVDEEDEEISEQADEYAVDDHEASYESALTDSMVGGLAVAASIAVLVLTSLTSHNAASPGAVRVPAVITDFIHLLAASAWIGGLSMLAILSIILLRRRDDNLDISDLLPMLSRFSPIAFISAGTLIVTGIVAGYLQVTIPAATATPYGWALVTKLALLVPLFGFAVFNSYRVSRKLIGSQFLDLRKSILIEVVIAVLVIACVGWLAGLEPARQYAGRNGIGVADSVAFSDFAEGANIDVTLTPGGMGKNVAEVIMTDRRGMPITNATDVRVRLKFLGDDLGEPLISLIDTGNGVWRGEDFNITIGGVYQAEISIVRPDAFDARTSFRFDAKPPASLTDAIAPDRVVTWTLLGLELLVIGALLSVMATPALNWLIPRTRVMAMPGVVVLVVGVGLLLNTQVLKFGFPEETFNPFPLNTESIEKGKAVYMSSCVMCHGEAGHGDGPEAAELNPRPAELEIHVPLHADSDLFAFIRDGIPGTAMPAQKGTLSDDEMWNLVNFLRTFERS